MAVGTGALLLPRRYAGYYGVRAVGVLPIAGFALFLSLEYGAQQAALALAAVLLGVVFYRSQFGFASTWRALLVRGDSRGLQAQMLWVMLTIIPFALLTGAVDGFTAQAAANVRPLSTAVVAGAFIFGIGMQLGGACTSGSIVGAGSGNSPPLVGIIGFIIGAILAASQIDYWTVLPGLEAVSFYQWGLSGALFLLLLAAAVFFAVRRIPCANPALSSASLSPRRAAVYLAILSVLLLVLGGQPWGLINGFSVAGGKLLLAAGMDEVLFWDFWARLGGEEVLTDGWFAGTQMVTNLGMLLGVLAAAGFAGKLNVPWRNLSFKRLLLALVGGVVMGYGAQISYGCNIGSYISALASGSAHGWLWLVAAFVGTAAGVRLRRLVGLES